MAGNRTRLINRADRITLHGCRAGLCRVAFGCQGLARSAFGVLDADRPRAARPGFVHSRAPARSNLR
jgi:hypothetical protein